VNIYIIVAAALVLWNVVVFGLYGLDKLKAKKNAWRISEATLVGCAFLMGGLGAFLAMSFFRHKTKHWKFKILVPVALILNVAVVLLLLPQVRGFIF